MRIFSSKKPIAIASPGHGIAAGGLLMLAADYRIGVDGDSRYGLNESAIGMVLPLSAMIWRFSKSTINIGSMLELN